MVRGWGGAAIAVCTGVLALTGCGGGRGDFADGIRRCIGNREYATVSRAADLAFALEDVRRGRAAVDTGGGQMRDGDETDFTFSVPSREAPRYVIVAILNQMTNPPASRRQDLASFDAAVRHPERFDAVMLSRAPLVKPFLKRLDNCMSQQIPL